MKSPPRRLLHAVAFSWLILSLQAAGAGAEELKRTYGFRAGYWIPGEQLLRDVLGSGVAVGASVSLPLRPDRWLDFEVMYWKGTGDFPPLEDETLLNAITYRTSEVTLAPLALSLRADAARIGWMQPFVLGGIDLNVVKEEVHFRQTHPEEPEQRGTNSLSNAFLGFHVGGGAQFDAGPRAVIHLEFRLSIVNADTTPVGGVVGNGVSLGGTGIFAGVRIK